MLNSVDLPQEQQAKQNQLNLNHPIIQNDQNRDITILISTDDPEWHTMTEKKRQIITDHKDKRTKVKPMERVAKLNSCNMLIAKTDHNRATDQSYQLIF